MQELAEKIIKELIKGTAANTLEATQHARSYWYETPTALIKIGQDYIEIRTEETKQQIPINTNEITDAAHRQVTTREKRKAAAEKVLKELKQINEV